MRRRFKAGGTNISNRNAIFFFCLFLLVFSIAFKARAVNEGCTIVPLNDWKFYFAGRDSSSSYSHFDSTRRYKDVTIPHTFPASRKNNVPRQGFGWYFRDVEVPELSSDKEIFLSSEGVSLLAKVFINGTYAGASSYPYLPFSINLTPFLKGQTKLHVAVMVDNRLIAGRLPDTRARGWWVYGGLIREIGLRVVPVPRIDDVRVFTIHRADDTFDLLLRFPRQDTAWDSVSLSFSAPDGPPHVFRATVRSPDTVLRFGGIRPWTPESPLCYRFAFVPYFADRPGDTLRLWRGFCQLAARESQLFLNGNPYYLRGMARHDVLDSSGPLLSREERRADLCDMKSMGVNFLRIAHFPQHRDIYELCDSLGILVMDEIPAWKSDPLFLGSARVGAYGAGYARAMAEAHANYTCVCLWSLGNQLASYKTAIADYVSAASAEVKKCDPSRPVTYCSYYYQWDKAFSHVDVISVNEYFGWELASLGMLGPMLDKIKKEWPGRPVLVSEFGAQSKPGLRNPSARLAGVVKSMVSKDLSEDHHTLFLRSHMDTIWTRRDFVAGMVVWSYNDYMSYLNKARTPDMPFGLNACGMVTVSREKKKSWNVVQQRFNLFRDEYGGK